MMRRGLYVLIGVLLVPTVGLVGDVVSDGKFKSTMSTGAPLDVASTDMVPNLNADMVDGVEGADLALADHSHTLSLVKTYGPPTFAIAPPHGQTLDCTFPAVNCQIITSGTTNLYFSLGIEGPATLSRVFCRVGDEDGETDNDITMRVINGPSIALGTDSTSGAPGDTDLVVDAAAVIDSGSRGPTVHLRTVRGSESMFVYHCYAEYAVEVP
jgi:hypothetical protein